MATSLSQRVKLPKPPVRLVGCRVSNQDHAVLVYGAELDQRNLQQFLKACGLQRAKELLEQNGIDPLKVEPLAAPRRDGHAKKRSASTNAQQKPAA
jgi:hypothetical protein